ncbi:MAG: protein jag [Spirochaetota bacterium]|jgi:spoIIIJ-associated protein|nr:protein jag [Spirochaetota bacterium]
MPVKEYEGKSEKELVKEAAKELGIDEANLRVTVLEKGKGGFLGLGEKVRIQVEYSAEQPGVSGELDDYEKITVEYLAGMFDLMGFDVDIEVDNNGQDRVFIELFSPDSGLIIGKHGKTLEAIQMLVNTVGARVPGSHQRKCVIDIENYRAKRESTLTDLAHRVAQEVIRTGRPRLLEPMNPFERRLIHLALQNETQVETKSEGEGQHRKVKISPKS